VLAQLNALAGCSPAIPGANPPKNAVAVTPLIISPRALDIPGMNVIVDAQGLVAKRYNATPGTTYLLRPDQHVVARWRTLSIDQLQAALARAIGANIGQA
jgi:3-(3-hydroxy-phenyl)propionate hydroxylase